MDEPGSRTMGYAGGMPDQYVLGIDNASLSSAQYSDDRRAARLGTPPVGKVGENVGCLKPPCALSNFGVVVSPKTPRIADRGPLMVRCRNFLRGKVSWSVASYAVFFFFFWPFARYSSWARPLPKRDCANGPPARLMRRINSPALRTARRILIREKAKWRNSLSPRQTHFALFLLHEPASRKVPPGVRQTSPRICSVHRLVPKTRQQFVHPLSGITVS